MAAVKDPSKLPGNGALPGPGRPPGMTNRVTRNVKDSLMAAYERIGGDKALGAWAKENPSEFYKLWAKLLPTKISGDEDGSPVRFSVTIRPHGVLPADDPLGLMEYAKD